MKTTNRHTPRSQVCKAKYSEEQRVATLKKENIIGFEALNLVEFLKDKHFSTFSGFKI
jgi:hypothetical protein